MRSRKKPGVHTSMATATLLRSLIRRRRDISAPLSAFKSISGAKTIVTGTYLSTELGIITGPFSWRPLAREVNQVLGIDLDTTNNQVIGIDLGTTNSRVAVMEGETAKVIRNAEGSLSTPRVVAFNEKEELVVGSGATGDVLGDFTLPVFGAKRLIGRQFDDLLTQKEVGRVPSYNIFKALNGDAWIEANGDRYSPTQIAAFVVAKMKETAENYLGKTVSEAVISVPGCFNKAQRQATEDAARIAGFNATRIIDDPTAAAIHYGLLNYKKDGLVAVFDLGGGTFDVSIFKTVDKIKIFRYEMIARNGDASLGGEDFDDALMDILIQEFKRTDGIYLTHDRFVVQRLREAAEKAKVELSTETQTNIHLPFIVADSRGAKDLNITLTRSEFEAQVDHLIQRIKGLCKTCMEDARITTGELDQVILVGGMSRAPLVEQVVTEIFGKTPIKVGNPDEAVALGAAFVGVHLFNKNQIRIIHQPKPNDV